MSKLEAAALDLRSEATKDMLAMMMVKIAIRERLNRIIRGENFITTFLSFHDLSQGFAY